jgi:hypothetical protein
MSIFFLPFSIYDSTFFKRLRISLKINQIENTRSILLFLLQYFPKVAVEHDISDIEWTPIIEDS